MLTLLFFKYVCKRTSLKVNVGKSKVMALVEYGDSVSKASEEEKEQHNVSEFKHLEFVGRIGYI